MFKSIKTLIFVILALNSTSAAMSSNEATTFKCLICWEESNGPLFTLSCGHEYCLNCIFYHVNSRINQHQSPECPNPNCKTPLTLDDLELMLAKGSENNIDVDINTPKYTNIIRDFNYIELARHQNAKICPTYGCSYAFVNEDVRIKIIECPECHQKYCCQCLKMHIATITCKRAQMQAELEEEERSKSAAYNASNKWISNNTKPCPRCKIPLTKNGGCNKVTCPKCHQITKWNSEKKH